MHVSSMLPFLHAFSGARIQSLLLPLFYSVLFVVATHRHNFYIVFVYGNAGWQRQCMVNYTVYRIACSHRQQPCPETQACRLLDSCFWNCTPHALYEWRRKHTARCDLHATRHCLRFLHLVLPIHERHTQKKDDINDRHVRFVNSESQLIDLAIRKTI